MIRLGEVPVDGPNGDPCLKTRLLKFLSSDLEL